MGELPEAVAGTLTHIVNQMDMLTQTMAMVTERLSIMEDKVCAALAVCRDKRPPNYVFTRLMLAKLNLQRNKRSVEKKC